MFIFCWFWLGLDFSQTFLPSERGKVFNKRYKIVSLPTCNAEIKNGIISVFPILYGYMLSTEYLKKIYV